MRVELRAVDSIKPYPGNPRRNDGAVTAVANSITAYGFRQPIVVDKAGVIVVGHTRWKAAKQLGLTQVPVHVADLSPEQAKAYRLADNKTSEIAEWDDDLLAGELADLQTLGVDIDSLGWTPEEIGEVLAPAENDGLTPADEVPEPTEAVVTKPGDLWILGQHRLLCGSSTNEQDVLRLMDGKKAAICATDPPYCIDYTGDRPEQSGKDWSKTYREIDIKDPAAFFMATLTQIKSVLAPNAALYLWHAHKRQAMLAGILDALEILNHQQIIWVKPTPVFGRSIWHFQHEPCLMGWVQGSMPPADGNHEHSSVWNVDWEGKARIVGNEHPTQKPVELFARPIRRHTKPGAVCFEPFSGSGSQLIAAEQLGRRCYAMELEPTFVEVAVRRWEAFTGKKAERVAASVVASK